MKRVHVYISGRVQGVCFRSVTRQKAQGFELTGWVRNMSDGRVEAVFEGEDPVVDKMLAWCQTGPSLARVHDVIINEESYTGEFQDFDIIY